jgi:hypothetical protein
MGRLRVSDKKSPPIWGSAGASPSAELVVGEGSRRDLVTHAHTASRNMIAIYRAGDPADKAARHEQFEWMAGKLERFWAAFYDRVRSLTLDAETIDNGTCDRTDGTP